MARAGRRARSRCITRPGAQSAGPRCGLLLVQRRVAELERTVERRTVDTRADDGDLRALEQRQGREVVRDKRLDLADLLFTLGRVGLGGLRRDELLDLC